jgi:hypothetical protein
MIKPIKSAVCNERKEQTHGMDDHLHAHRLHWRFDCRNHTDPARDHALEEKEAMMMSASVDLWFVVALCELFLIIGLIIGQTRGSGRSRP